MTEQDQRFDVIYRELLLVPTERERILDFLSNYSREYIEQFVPTACKKTGFFFYSYERSGGSLTRRALHSTDRPAATNFARNRNLYYLFYCLLTQREWFSALRFSEEEKLIHCLKWGSQDE